MPRSKPYFAGKGRPLPELLRSILSFTGHNRPNVLGKLLERADNPTELFAQLSTTIGRKVVLGTPAPKAAAGGGELVVAVPPSEGRQKAVPVITVSRSCGPRGGTLWNWMPPRELQRNRPSGADIRRIARRAGVKRFRGDIHGETAGILTGWLRQVLQHCVALTELKRRRSVSAETVVEALQHADGGIRLYR